MFERTNSSVPLYLRELSIVLRKAWPVLGVQALLVAVLVLVDQGRAFLLFDSVTALSYLIAFGAFATVVLVRRLAGFVEPDPSPDPAATDRLRWLALHSGSGVAGLISGFLPAALIEIFVLGQCEIPPGIRDSYRGSAALITMLVIVVLLFWVTWRIQARKADKTTTRDVWLMLTSWLAAWLANQVAPSYHLLAFGLILVVAMVLLPLTVLKGPSPPTVRGGLVQWLARLILAVFLIAGFYQILVPAGASGSVTLWIGLQFWTAVAVLLSLLLRRLWASHLAGYWLLLVILVIAAGAFSGKAFHGRPVRTIATAPAARPQLATYARQWLQNRAGATNFQAPYPIILVASAGGGIRAGYWTANLLAALQDQTPEFSSHLFAISAVSGGSVGAAVYAALLKSNCHPCRPAARKILRADFLAPALGGLLTRDVISTMLPVGLPDRAIALEKAFEQAWRATMHNPLMEQPYQDLWRSDESYRIPALFLNSTEAASAERAVFSPLSLAGLIGGDPAIQQAAERLPIRLSTAMLLSARFPYISPEAVVPVSSGLLRFVDGGYFDNSGAATLLDVAGALRGEIQSLGMDSQFQLIIVSIRNDPSADPGCLPKPETGGFGTPLHILDKLRGRRADQFTAQLKTLTSAAPRGLFLDEFRPVSTDAELPLGWTLPRESADAMDRQITGPLQEKLQEIARLLQTPAGSAPAK